MSDGAKTGTEDTFEEVHVTLADGRTIYWPKGDMSRLAPAAVCSVASRMQRLRAELKKDRYDMREIERLINEPIAFEKQFLSGDSLTVHNALKEAGKDPLTEALKVAGEAQYFVGQLLADLPAKRDWLDPDIERALKDFTNSTALERIRKQSQS